jgi:hypothetical protein
MLPRCRMLKFPFKGMQFAPCKTYNCFVALFLDLHLLSPSHLMLFTLIERLVLATKMALPSLTLTNVVLTSGPLVAYTSLHIASAPCWTALQPTLWELLPMLSMRAQRRRPWQGITTSRLSLQPTQRVPTYAGQPLPPRYGHMHVPLMISESI